MDVEKEQIELKKGFRSHKTGRSKDKSQEQQKTINDIKNLYKSRKEVAQMFDDHSKNMSRNISYSKQGKGIKILTPKQILQRLPKALA